MFSHFLDSSIMLRKPRTLKTHLTHWLHLSDIFQVLSNWATGYFCSWGESHEDHHKSLYQMGTDYLKPLYKMFFVFFFLTFLVVTGFHPNPLYEHYASFPIRDSVVGVEKNNVYSQFWVKTSACPLPSFEAWLYGSYSESFRIKTSW